MISTRIIAAGAFLPDRSVSNERLVKAIPGWPADTISQKTGIVERRFLWDFDEATGRAIVPNDGSVWPRTNTDMCEAALRQALERGGIKGSELDAIFVVTCTPDELNFSHDAVALHQRLGCRADAMALVIDSGCGGALYIMDLARKLIEGGQIRTAAVIASNFTSAYVDRDVFTSSVRVGGRALGACLSMYLFGDGAGAILMRGEHTAERDPCTEQPGFLRSCSGTDGLELVVRRGGGALHPPHAGRSAPDDHSFVVNGPLVAERFPEFMRRGIDRVTADVPELVPQIDRYYLHQANKRLVEGFAIEAGIPLGRLAMHMERYGNISAAGTLVLLAEDLESGVARLGSGQLVLFAAIGAGVHYGAHLVRL